MDIVNQKALLVLQQNLVHTLSTTIFLPRKKSTLSIAKRQELTLTIHFYIHTDIIILYLTVKRKHINNQEHSLQNQ